MRTPLSISPLLGATLLFSGVLTAHAAEGRFYDPRNAASPTGFTTGYELFRTIGCPGQVLLGKPCPVPPKSDAVAKSEPTAKTEPTKATDSDGDGVPDTADRCPDVFARTADGCPAVVSPLAPTAPATPAPAPASAISGPISPAADYTVGTATGVVSIPRRLVLTGVNFDFDKATLLPEARDIIDKNAAVLKDWGDIQVEVSGHTDDVGTDRYNLALSLRRADAVRDYLIGKGIAADRLLAKGYGESDPIADNDTNDGRAQNRRVELNQIDE